MGKRPLVVVSVTVLLVITALAATTYWLNINSPLKEQTTFRSEYGDVTLDAPIYNFTPPVSMYHALNTALNEDWNETSLQNKTIHVSLDYYRFYNDSKITKSPYDNTTLGPSRGMEFLNTITQPVSDYSAVTLSNETVTSTYRYLWHLSITETFQKVPGCPNPNYWIDAKTAERVDSPGPPG
jgi:hypothetical protein